MFKFQPLHYSWRDEGMRRSSPIRSIAQERSGNPALLPIRRQLMQADWLLQRSIREIANAEAKIYAVVPDIAV